jgi:uncharacterized protein YecT (DUF1311 family)
MAVRSRWFVIATVACIGTCLPEDLLAQRAGAYETFTITGVQSQGMNSSRFENCMDRANAETSILDCYHTEKTRLLTLLSGDFRRAAARLSPARARRLRASQQDWQSKREQDCFDKFESQAAALVERVSVDIQACQQNEIKRRIFWVRALR